MAKKIRGSFVGIRRGWTPATRDRLVKACRFVWDDDQAFEAAMVSLPLTKVVEMAAIEAFIFEVNSPDVDVVREALKKLRLSGQFTFEEERSG